VTVTDTAPADSGVEPPSPARSGLGWRAGDLLRRYWATASIVAAVLVAGVTTGALWNGVDQGTALYDRVAYGLPALQDGRWWTFFTGIFFAPEAVLYVPILALIISVASVYERRLGHLRTLVVAIGGQFLAGLLTALFLWIWDDSGWTWAVQLGNRRGLGIAAGGFALLGVLTAVMQPVWRRRMRVGFGAYLVAMLLGSGLLWDVEHLVGFTLGVVFGPMLAGRRAERPEWHFGRRSQRPPRGADHRRLRHQRPHRGRLPRQRRSLPLQRPGPERRRADTRPGHRRGAGPHRRRQPAAGPASGLGVHPHVDGAVVHHPPRSAPPTSS
jgi:hypothetical protein